MKLLLLGAFCTFSTYAIAQLPKKANPYIFQLPDTLQRFKGNENAVQQLWQRRQLQKNLMASQSGNIIILPQDNMSCVVPDTNGIVKIPNPWSGASTPYISQYRPIPNPALPKVQSFKYNALDNSLGIPSK
ncbi:MAG TPA: hypothetical protein VNT20_16080 [Flavisolibacter sp.]|jgi:hypothetical protein|nr:hypothetical protein [Flavisolibacter sp.]